MLIDFPGIGEALFLNKGTGEAALPSKDIQTSSPRVMGADYPRGSEHSNFRHDLLKLLLVNK